MITINFLQTQNVKPNNYTRWKSFVVAMGMIFALIVGPTTLARVPEDFMNQPAVTFPTANAVIPKDQFEVRGTAHNWANVDITIDGKLAGRATSTNGRGSNATFSFKPAPLSVGRHWIQASVRSETEVFRSPLTTSILVEIVEPIPAPTLDTFRASNDPRRPYIRGTVTNNTRVEIFIDGKLDQIFDAVGSGPLVSFSVQPRQALADGFHTVTAKSRNALGVVSNVSNQRIFVVKAASTGGNAAPGLTGKPSEGISNPRAPTLLKPENGSVLNTKRATVQGLAPNSVVVRAYVDGTLDQEVPVVNHPSGTASFSFTTRELESGYHGVYTTARTIEGTTSSRSNELEFMIRPEGSVPVFTPSGETSVWYPNLQNTDSNKPVEERKLPVSKPITSSTPKPDSNQGSVQGDTTTSTTPTQENGTSDTEKEFGSKTPTRVIIGWIILAISVLGIIAYIISTIIEHRQKDKNKLPVQPTSKTTVNLNQGSTQQPQSQPKKQNPDDDLGLNDDIPKGYQ